MKPGILLLYDLGCLIFNRLHDPLCRLFIQRIRKHQETMRFLMFSGGEKTLAYFKSAKPFVSL